MDEEPTVAEETDAEETEEELAEAEDARSSGPGFILGIALGTLAGAAAAALFAPATGEELRWRAAEETAPEVEPEGSEPADRARAILSRVRARVREASLEAKEAAREAEERGRARYEELTGRQQPRQ
ncbi:MAG: hypothetical protein U1B78_08250 [Dehalococcoidia bacterium]|nr:hypothetical protein [Dehalococcoidia bacterium]